MTIRVLLTLTLIALPACGDSDRDGTRNRRDCSPQNAGVNGDAVEICDGKDNDCDGQIDEGVSILAYWDRDLDGFGDAQFARRVCTLPDDGSLVAGDCNDANAAVNPDATEICDLLDNDCDNVVDEDADLTFYEDLDGDGHGTSGATVMGCWVPDGFAPSNDDCDDADPEAWTDRPEECDAADNDCDGLIDEDVLLERHWGDADGDGFGDPNSPVVACGPSPGVADNDLDCDDGDPARHPDAIESRTTVGDEDCDGYFEEYGIGPGNEFATVAAALDVAPDGSVLQLDSGTHVEQVDLQGRDVTLAGEGCDRSSLFGDGTGTAVLIDGGAIENLRISGGTGAPPPLEVLVDEDVAEYGGGVQVLGDTAMRSTCISGNTSAGAGGGIAVLLGTLALSDSDVNGNTAVRHGGGVFVGPEGQLELLRGRVFGNVTTSGRGGGLALLDSEGLVRNAVIAGNVALEFGGGVYAYSKENDPLSEHLDRNNVPLPAKFADLDMAFTTLHANRLADASEESRGAAVFVSGSHAALSHVAVTGHPDAHWLLSDTRTHWNCADAVDCVLELDHIGVSGNGTTEIDLNEYLLERIAGDPRYVRSDTPLDRLDLRLLDGSAFLDAGDPLILDLDGTPADLGAFGGPDADPSAANPRLTDTDADGMPDGWELHTGTNIWVDDSAEDTDGDGSSHGQERIARTLPLVADTDADGVDDGAERQAGTNPLDRRDHGPTADAGADQFALLNTAALFDGGASFDPDNGALTYAWSLISVPGLSAASITNPTTPVAELVPDVAGTYTLLLTVTEGTATHSDLVSVHAADGVIVPDDYPDVALAMAAIAPGEAVAVRPGLWRGTLDPQGKDVTVFGLGDPTEVVLDGSAEGSVFSATGGERITLGNVTLQHGFSDRGGGLHVVGGLELSLVGVHVRDNDAFDGGGAWIEDTPTHIQDSWFVGNESDGTGGGLALITRNADSQDVLDTTVLRSVITGNRADQGGGLYIENDRDGRKVINTLLDDLLCSDNQANQEGSCAYVTGLAPDLHIRNASFLANRGGSVLFTGSTGHTLVHSSVFAFNNGEHLFGGLRSSKSTSAYLHYDGIVWRNVLTGDPWFSNAGAIADVQTWHEADPVLLTVTPDGDPSDDYLAPGPASERLDRGLFDRTDPDHSRSDIGACAGPEARAACGRGIVDSDGDGQSDGWELFYGLDPAVPDGMDDLDGDGVNNRDERVQQSNPSRADTDFDGMSDAVDPLPNLAADSRPVAEPGPIAAAVVGSPLALDGGASTDPNGDPLTFSWRFVSMPLASTLTDADWTDRFTATPQFVPDVPGAYRIGLVVDDGASASREEDVLALGGLQLLVPDVYATAADALAAAAPGDTIQFAAGSYPVSVDPGGVLLTFAGAGSGATVLQGAGHTPMFQLGPRDHITLRDMTIAGAASQYGGAVRCEDADLTTRGAVFVDNLAEYGGALHLTNCHTTLIDTELRDNASTDYGGAMWAFGGSLQMMGGGARDNATGLDGGAIYLEGVDAEITNVGFIGNDAERDGSALELRDHVDAPGAAVTLDHNTFANHQGTGQVVHRQGGIPLVVTHNLFIGNRSLALWDEQDDAGADVHHNGWWDNDSDADPAVFATGPEDVHGEPGFVDASVDDLRLTSNSAFVDVGADVDPDGTPGDLGAHGGPMAAPGWDGWLFDGDGDGMVDGWEVANGLDPADPTDGDLDADADGLDNATEHALATDPNSADTDQDGVSDGLEAGVTDPRDAADNAPTADAPDAPTEVDPFTVVTLTGAVSDPNGDPLSVRWRIADQPGRSALTDADLVGASNLTVQLVPDAPGLFVLELVADDGAATSSPDTALVLVRGDVQVPEDYPTIAGGLAALADGYTLDVAAGTWPAVVDLDGRDATIRGAGAETTVLDAQGQGSVVVARSGEHLILEELTVTGGRATQGGGLHLDNASVTLLDVTVRDNVAVDGGGLFAAETPLTCSGMRMVDNLSVHHGGGAFLSGFSTTTDVVQSIVAGNQAPNGSGGGIFLTSHALLDVTNAVFADNLATAGGAISDASSTGGTVLSYVTATFNQASSLGAFYDAASARDAVVSHAIVADNHGAAAIRTGVSVSLDQTFTLLHDNDDNYLSATGAVDPVHGVDGNQIDSGDPALGDSDDMDWTNDQWWPDPTTSAAVDAGDPLLPSDPDGTVSDLGAFGGPLGDWAP